MIKVSIIIPVFNKEERINRSIESVLNQTYKDFELILVNDGSTDCSGDIIEQYKKNDSRITYIRQENKGVSSARNKGIELSKGEYVAFLDADDEYTSTFLEEMLKSIGNSNACYCGHYNLKNGKKCKSNISFFRGDIFEQYLYNKCTPNTNSWIIKKDFLNKYDIRFSLNVDWGEDMEFFSKILLYNKDIKCAKKYLTYYFISETNCLSENNLNKIYKDISWMEGLKEFISLKEINNERKNKLIKAIETYRLPALIIYRINMNLEFCDNKELLEIIKDVKQYVNKLKFSNGLRSLKLYYYRYKLNQLI